MQGLLFDGLIFKQGLNYYKDSYFGNFTNAKIQKKSGKIKLEVWKPWLQYVRKRIPPQLQSALLDGPQELTVEYDEVWISEYDELFTEAEKEKYKGQFDLTTLYWKDVKYKQVLQKSFMTAIL